MAKGKDQESGVGQAVDDWERSSTGSPAGREIQKAKIRALVTKAWDHLTLIVGEETDQRIATEALVLVGQALVEALLYTRDFA